MSTCASGRAAQISALMSSAAIGIGSALRFDQLASCFYRFLSQSLTDLAFIGIAAGGGEIAEYLADHVLVPRFLEVGPDDVLGIGFRLDRGQLHQAGSPVAEELVATGDDAELQFLVMR